MRPEVLTRKACWGLVVAVLLAGEGMAGTGWVDPTRPPEGHRKETGGSQKEEAPAVKADLQSILVGDRKRVAVIGGRPRRVGEAVGAYTVAEISKDRVVLRGEGGTRVLRLSRSSGFSKAPSN